ncbi:MAG: NADH-quinone oxidoreductase subunit H, partial [Aigarchaeota archaeon]|nr:NADH-quinone oxidoreductase subunit H [Aigarchaeota archaeon]
IGATRILTQLLGYDIPLVALAACPAFLARSLSISKISASQHLPYALLIPWAFLLFIVVLLAELEKDPFDIPQAETELVAGYETEFSGRRLAILRLARDFQLVFGAALTTSLFLGGPQGPVIFGPASLWQTFWFIAKMLLMLVVFEYVGAIAARLRIDQLVRANWTLLVQLSVLSLVATVASAPLLQLITGVV